jgi:hypothetical protein
VLAGLESGQCSNSGSVQGLALEETGLDDELRVGLCEIRQGLGGCNGVTLDEGDSSGSGKLAFERVDAGFLGCNASQGVLYDRELGVLAQRNTQLLELCNGKPAVFG